MASITMYVDPDFASMVTGEWCDACQLPSGISLDLYGVTLTTRGVDRSLIGTAHWCLDHHGPTRPTEKP